MIEYIIGLYFTIGLCIAYHMYVRGHERELIKFLVIPTMYPILLVIGMLKLHSD